MKSINKQAGVCGPRVTILGEFSPIGRLFTLDNFCKIDRSFENNWAMYFFHSKSYVLIFTKTDWATFVATFSKSLLPLSKMVVGSNP
jgi:hypothetical protein